MTDSCTTAVVPTGSAGAAAPRRGAAVAWAVAVLLVAGYAVFYGGLIWQSTAVPTFDQAAYMNKTYAIAEAFWHHPLRLANPWTFLGEPAANRPPLMMVVPAMLLGPGADPRAIGIAWMLLRLGVLLAGVRVIARQAGGGAWVPTAVAAMLAAPGSLILYPNMYMMDQAFEAFGLLAFGLLARDLLQRRWQTAAWGAAGTVMLLLIKPAALVFVFPLYVMLLLKAVAIWRAERQGPWAALGRWLWPYATMGGVMLVIFASPYGLAVAQQYGLGSRGYWATDKSLLRIVGMVALLAPPWLLAMVGLSVAVGGVRGMGRQTGGLIRAAGWVVGWWFVFNAFLTYTLDPRILPAAMPVAVVGGLLVVRRSRVLPAVALAVALGSLGVSVLASQDWLPEPVRKVANAVAPVPAAQAPVTEVGLLEAAREIRQQIVQARAADPASAARAGKFMLVCHDDQVELDAMKLAMKYTGGNAGLMLDCFPWGSTDMSLPDIFDFEWFLTKGEHKATDLRGEVWTNMEALDALILDPKSPLAGMFEPVREFTVHQSAPSRRVDTLTLWRLKEPPSAEQLRAAYAFIWPRYKGTSGEAEMRGRLAKAGVAAP